MALSHVTQNNVMRLVEYCAENDLLIGGTLFDHTTIQMTTWRLPDYVTRNQIDVRTYRWADIGRDHELVIAKI